jgi:hypothetical protein
MHTRSHPQHARPPKPVAGTCDRFPRHHDSGPPVDTLDDAGCWTQLLVQCADTVFAGYSDILEKERGRSQDAECLQFLLEEAKVASNRVREAAEALSEHLKAGNARPGGPTG